MSSANSSFSSYGGGDEEEQNEAWLNGGGGGNDIDGKSAGSVQSKTEATFDDKYEFLDHTILGEVIYNTL